MCNSTFKNVEVAGKAADRARHAPRVVQEAGGAVR